MAAIEAKGGFRCRYTENRASSAEAHYTPEDQFMSPTVGCLMNILGLRFAPPLHPSERQAS
jgi:hypothetical protein